MKSLEEKKNFLLNRSIKFNKEKVEIFDEIVECLYGKNIQKVQNYFEH